MSVFNVENFHEGLVSELALFDLPSTQTSVTHVYDEEIRPLSQPSESSPIEFRISGNNSMDYLDLKNSQLYVKLRVKTGDGKALTAEKVGPVNLFLQALFSTTEVTLQNKATITCNYNPYRAIIQTLLNYGDDALASQIQSQIFSMDDADSPGDTDPAGANSGLYARSQFIKSSKTVDLQGPIFHDLFSMSRYLLNQVDVKVKLYRTSPAFCLSSGDSAPNFKIEIDDIYMLARKVRVNSAVIFGHAEIMKAKNAMYPFTRTDVKVQSIANGSTSFQWDNIFQGQKPDKVIIGFVKSKAVSGDYKSNPFNFCDVGIQSICLYTDNLAVGGNPLKLSFDSTDGNAAMRAFTNFMMASGKWRYDQGTALDRNLFTNGNTLFAFQLEPSFPHHGEFLSLIKTGNVRLDCQFKTPISEPYSCIIYSESGSYFEINKERNIITE